MRYKKNSAKSDREVQIITSGQVMILTVLALGGTLLGATTVAGLLMLYQLRQTTNFQASARAITAADAGLEWGLYNQFCDDATPAKSPCPRAPLVFENNATVEVTCLDDSGSQVVCTDENVEQIKSIGSSGGASRAFLLTF